MLQIREELELIYHKKNLESLERETEMLKMSNNVNQEISQNYAVFFEVNNPLD